jgi:hypothetical protein
MAARPIAAAIRTQGGVTSTSHESFRVTQLAPSRPAFLLLFIAG